MIDARQILKVFAGSKKSPPIVAVDHLSLIVNKGEVFALLGPNGAGKTTTIRMLAGILPLTSGEAIVAGYDIREPELVRKNVGILTETPGVYERLSGLRNLEFFGRTYGLSKEAAKKRSIELAKRFDLSERINTPAGSYSKGMKQKLAILKAIAHDPPLVFLDEPTSALDPVSAKTVRDLILELTKSDGRTIFINTHNLDEAERLADRIAIINRGRLVAIGNPKDLKKQPIKLVRIGLGAEITAPERLSSIVKSCPGVIDVALSLNSSHFDFTTAESVKSVVPGVVEALVRERQPVVEVRTIEQSLEDIYFREVGYQAP